MPTIKRRSRPVNGRVLALGLEVVGVVLVGALSLLGVLFSLAGAGSFSGALVFVGVLEDFDGEVPLAGGVLAGGVALGGVGVFP
jgi:hypothetical protein